nr:immunoglobulin heavy chain junction region [Mus musculus]MBK4189672.1 immunoglobulin heavy chain junction region [Mus musculus]MBK4189673.1 immunoglobulin heavy chain junction region [Mus musculus]MBK4189674.1 immunoglobulin heavy chain junction region [Mus musculus]MBK4189675.1 immunoglobulin heavy chain junction region [Mus musculus]
CARRVKWDPYFDYW